MSDKKLMVTMQGGATMNSSKGLQSTATQSQSINGVARLNALSNVDADLPPTQRLAPTQQLSGVSA